MSLHFVLLALVAGFFGALVMPTITTVVASAAAAYARSRWGMRGELRALDRIARSSLVDAWPYDRQKRLFRRIAVLNGALACATSSRAS